MRTFVYVDGLNLYYRAARRHNLKWLDIHTLCKNKLNLHNEILKIKYFTSIVRRDPKDPRKPTRQQLLIRALSTTPHLEIIKGTFNQNEDWRPLADDPTKMVRVLTSEEKGSDVNLAVHVVNDAHLDCYDAAIVISNDSDLTEAIVIAREREKIVGLLSPVDKPNEHLKRAASFTKTLEKSDLVDAEFPRIMKDADGCFHRPREWD